METGNRNVLDTFNSLWNGVDMRNCWNCVLISLCLAGCKGNLQENNVFESLPMGKPKLTDEQIIKAADDFISKTIDRSEYIRQVDEHNKEWLCLVAESTSSFVHEQARQLENRDYQSVLYTYRTPVLGGRYWVFVDTCTGDIITAFGEK